MATQVREFKNSERITTGNTNIATAMVVNSNLNYHFVGNSNKNFDTYGNNSSSSFITPDTSINYETSNSESNRTATPTSFNYSVNNIAQSINNSLSLVDKSFTLFGSNLLGSSNIGYSASLVSSAQANANLENKCLRCANQVYALERIGPIKGNIYHKTCFKCLICERQLDLKTYYTNQINLADRQIYCQTHAPKSGKGSFGADNVHIQNVLNAPKLDLIHRHDNKHKAIIDGNARHILHAINAQHLVQMTNRKDLNSGHCFPAYPHISTETKKTREAIRKAQEVLEAQQRAEEDKLLQKFRAERNEEEQKLESEVQEEWEKRLQAIHEKYERDLKNKRDQMEANGLSQRFQKEKIDLEKNMTLKREKKRDDAKRTLLQLEQEATAELVAKHSGEMLKLIKAKEQEVLTNGSGPENGEGKRKNSTSESNKSLSPSMLMPPPPQPPVRRKRDLYDDPGVFEFIDQQAINVAESEQTSYTELVDQLTDGLVTDLEKARAIFRWITVKDLNAIEFNETLNPDTPLGLLRGIKFGTETYHTLFMRLCSYAGLHCVDIKGHSKSVGYEPGMKIQPGKFTNTWNAVLLDGEWRFVQCNWGARHLVMSKDKKLEQQQVNTSKPSRDKIKYQYDEHYFLPDPEEFILEFFPHNPDWQLLEQPINLDEFESLPFVRSLFFHYHLDFVNQRQTVITTNTRGACDIKLRMPEDLKQRLAFHFHLRLANREENEVNGIKLERFVLHTIQDDLVSFNVHVPQVGDYFIEVFASLVEPDANPFGQSFKLKCVCKYKIVCEELTQRMHPLPSCASGEWGPMKAMRHFNIQPLTHKSAIIEAQQTQFEVKFELPKALKIHGKMHNNNQNDLDKFVKHEVIQSSSPLQLTILVTLPEEGQYGLDIYARDPDYQSEKRTMSHCCKYLINFNKRLINQHLKQQQLSPGQTLKLKPETITTPTGNPQIQLIGPNTEFLNYLGMVPVSYREPVIVFDENPSCELQFKMTKAVDFSFDLKYDPSATPLATATFVQLKASEHVKVKQIGYTINFTVNLPIGKLGNYLFTIYASDDQNKTKNLPAVFTYLMKYELKTKKK